MAGVVLWWGVGLIYALTAGYGSAVFGESLISAGMGITQKALAHGVPVVAVPFGRDQPEVARRVEVSGAGVRLPLARLTGPGLRDAVDRAIDRQAGARVIAKAFAAAGGPSAAADVLETLIGQVRSPQRQTPSAT